MPSLSRVLILPLVAAATLLSGCAGRSKVLSPAERSAQFKINRDAYATLGYRHDWNGFPEMSRGGRVREFDIFGDVVVVQESSGILSVLEAASGERRWSEPLGNPLTRFVGSVRDGNRLICCSQSDAFYLDLDTGTLVNKHALDLVVNTRPTLVGNLLVFGTASGEILGQLKGQGFRAWGNTVRGAVEANPAVLEGGVLGFVSQSGEIAFLDGATGSGMGRAWISGGVDVDPAASQRTMYVASQDQSLYAFEVGGGRERWRLRTDTPLRYPPVYHDGRVYCAIDGAGLLALDSTSGSQLWTCPDILGYVVGIRNGKLLVWESAGEAGGEIASLDPQSGSIVDRFRLERAAFLRTDKFVDGNMYVATAAGLVAKFVPR
jgi:outer membrane protein assembly factor BamB